MRPLIGLVMDADAVDLHELVGLIQGTLDLEYGDGDTTVGLQLITTEAELAGFQAGHLVLYRKPVRRSKPTDVSYRKPDGTVIKREQTTLFND